MKRHFLVSKGMTAALLMAALLLISGCGAARQHSNNAQRIVIQIEDYDPVSSSEYIYFLRRAVSEYEAYNGRVDWAAEIDGVSANEYFAERAAEGALLYRVLERAAVNWSVELTAEELDAVEQSIDKAIADAGGQSAFESALSANGMDMELYRRIAVGAQRYYKLRQTLCGEGGQYAPDSQQLYDFYRESYYRLEYVRADMLDSEGEQLPDEELLAISDALELMHEFAIGGDSLIVLADSEETVQVESLSSVLHIDELPDECLVRLNQLDQGGVSDIFQCNSYWWIIRRLSLSDEWFDQNGDSVSERYSVSKTDSLLDSLKADMSITRTPQFYEISVSGLFS